MTVIPPLQAQYLQNLKMKRDKATSAPNPNKRDGTAPSRALPDPYKEILDNHKELKVLEKLQKLLKTFYKLLLEAVQRGDEELAQRFRNPSIFQLVLKTKVTERICYLYKKNKTSLIKTHGTPEMALIRLVDNQIEVVKTNILFETLWSEMCQLAQGTQQSDCLKTNKPPQQRKVSAPMGSDDIITSEELEQAEDEFPPNATPGHNDAGNENENENEEFSPNLIKE